MEPAGQRVGKKAAAAAAATQSDYDQTKRES